MSECATHFNTEHMSSTESGQIAKPHFRNSSQLVHLVLVHWLVDWLVFTDFYIASLSLQFSLSLSISSSVSILRVILISFDTKVNLIVLFPAAAECHMKRYTQMNDDDLMANIRVNKIGMFRWLYLLACGLCSVNTICNHRKYDYFIQ